MLAVQAIGGLHVVTIAWYFVKGQEAKRDGLLGFAIERSELDNGKVIERYFLKLLELDDASATTVEITTEAEEGGAGAGKTKHDIYFNRGVAGSQGYELKYGKTKPDEAKPESDQMKWMKCFRGFSSGGLPVADFPNTGLVSQSVNGHAAYGNST